MSFADAEPVFEDPLAVHRADPDAEDEERFVAIGLGGAGETLVVVYVLHGAWMRLISERRPTKREGKAYAS